VPLPFMSTKARRLRLMPSGKWSFTTDSMHGDEWDVKLRHIVGDETLSKLDRQDWHIFDLHCVAGDTACFAVQVFLRMFDRLSWEQFSPAELAPVLVPHTSTDDLIDDFVNHDAALFLDPQPEKVLFQELYAAGIPMWVPDVLGMASRLFLIEPLCEENIGLGMETIRETHSWMSPDILAARESYAVEPFNFTADSQGHFKAWYWLQLSDFNAPHVATFRSVSDLLLQVATADLQAMGSGMREHYNKRMDETRIFFVNAIGSLLTGEALPS